MVNKVILAGNLGGDPDLKQTPGGNLVCNVSIATSENWKDQNGEWQSSTEWHDLVGWGRMGENMGAALKKGMAVYVEGKLVNNTWQDAEGKNRRNTKVQVSMFRKLSKPSSGGSGSNEPGYFPGANDEPDFV